MLYVTSSSSAGSGSGSGFIYTLHDSNTLTAEPGYHYILDTMAAGGAVTVTLPQGNNGDTIAFSDRTDTFSSSNVTLNSTGTDTLTDGFSQSLTLDVDRSVIQLTFFNGIWSITGAAGIVDNSWGNITGDIQNQTDLINILETKTDVPAVEALVQAGLNKLRSSTKFYVSKTGSDSNVGTSLAEPFLTVRHAVSQSNPGDVIEIEAGVYEEICPIVVPRDVAIQGDALRRTIIKPTPQTNLLGIFKVDSGFYCDGITFAGHQADNSGNISFAISLNQNADNTDIGASDIGAYILKSPYVRNCTSYTAEDDDGLAGSLSTGTTGGGFLIDGAACASNSPIRSFVVDSFTQINLNGPGGLIRNNGYCQLVSCFGTFCSYHVKCETGGQVNLSNSTTNFGTYGLVADGYSPSPIFTAELQSDAYGIPEVLVKPVFFNNLTDTLTSNNHGFVTNTKVTFKATDGELPSEITPGLTYYVINPLINTFQISTSPSGSPLTFSTNGDGTFEVKAQGDTSVNLINFTENTIGPISRPLPGMLMFLNDTPYVVTGSTPITNGYNVSFYSETSGGLSENILSGSIADFRLRSQIATSGHNMEYVGAGTNYLALPWYGGVPIPENQIQEFNNGKVFYTTIDELGNFKVGSAFSVDGTTGAVTISTDELNLSGLNYIGPFSRNGGFSTVGVQLKEVSDDNNLIASTGSPDGNTVPTQTAVVNYIQNNYLALDGSNSPTDNLDLGGVDITNIGLVDGVDISARDHDAVTVTDSSEIDFTLTGQNITAELIPGSIDKTKLDASVRSSLDLADSSIQPIDFALKAPLASPALTGTPTAPTAAFETNTTQIATTAFVTTAVNNIKTIYETVKNLSGVTLAKGTPLHIIGNSGNEAEVIAADANLNYPAQLILNESLIDQAVGQAVVIGFINNVTVPDASLYSPGDEVYLAPGGGWTTTRPTGTSAVQKLGVILKVNSGNNTVSGILYGLGNNEDLPNLPKGKIWVGDSNGVPTTADFPIILAYHNTSTLSPTNQTVYQLDTSSTAITVTLPDSPTNGTWYGFCDYRGTFSTNNVTINRSGTNTIINNVDTSVTLTSNYQNLWLAYYNGIWSVISAESFVDAGGSTGNGYRYLGTQILTSGTAATYTPTTGTRMIRVRVYGATGGGGGADGQGAGTNAIGAAGGNGGYTEKEFLISGQTFTYTVGAAGVGGVAGNNAGTAGGTTSFTASVDGTIQVTGGAGGPGSIGLTTGSVSQGNPGVGSGGTFNITGNRSISGRWSSDPSLVVIIVPNNGFPLFGGSNIQTTSADGAASTTIGAGGMGAYAGAVTTNYAGGNGFRGEIRIEEYI